MANIERIEILKTTIEHLYSKEGRSLNYISKLLEINRKTLSEKVKEWNLSEPEPRHHFTPSVRKFLNKNRNLIKSRLDHDISITRIAKELGVKRELLQKTVIPNDPILKKAREDYIRRMKESAAEKKRLLMDKSRLDYDVIDLPGEEWRPILGWEGYMVSNKARVKHLAKRYGDYHLVKAFPNEVCILSAVFPLKHAYEEKQAWLDEHLPFIGRGSRFFVSVGENKSHVIDTLCQDDHGVLGQHNSMDCKPIIFIDDYNRNLREVQGYADSRKRPVVPVKCVCKGTNDIHGSWNGKRIYVTDTPEQIKECIMQCIR